MDGRNHLKLGCKNGGITWRANPRCVDSAEAAYGTAKSGVGIASMGVMRPDMIMRLGSGDATGGSDP